MMCLRRQGVSIMEWKGIKVTHKTHLKKKKKKKLTHKTSSENEHGDRATNPQLAIKLCRFLPVIAHSSASYAQPYNTTCPQIPIVITENSHI